MRTGPRSWGPAILVGLLAFSVTVEIRARDEGAGQLAGRRAQLARVVAARQRSTAQLERELADLRRRADVLAAGASDASVREARALADRLETLAGTTPASGPGVVVTLADANTEEGEAAADDLRIQDQDIQAVVNALWAAGAEAIAVNDQRVVSTTAIRNAGGAVLVNYKVLTSPYRVAAVGDARAMREEFGRSQIARRFRNWVEIYGLGFRVGTAPRLTLPGYAGRVRVRYARPAKD